MKVRLRNTLAIAGLLSIMTFSGVRADDRVIVTYDDWEQSSGLSNITTADSGNGGAIFNNGYSLSILGGTYENNLLSSVDQAVFGGAVYQAYGSLNIANGVIFQGNQVKSASQTYPGWNGQDSASGGAIYITAADLTMGDVQFINNKVLNNTAGGESNGGAIFMQGVSSATMGNVVFTGNSANTRGGAIYNGDSAITINGAANFSQNTAKTGGAIYMYDVTGTTEVNSGTGSTFDHNVATGNGGAVANFDGTLNIGEDNTFSANTANNGKGGAIYNASFSGTSTTTVAGGTSFTGNSAKQGGAIYNSGDVTLTSAEGKDITFSGNTATEGGASVYLDGTGASLAVDGTAGTVSFRDNGAIAGNGNITKSGDGIIEFVGNKDVSKFSGQYTQTGGTLSLDNSNMFNKYDVQAGTMELLNGSTATIDGTNRKFSGSVLSVSGTNSLLTLGTDSLAAAIGKEVQVNLLAGGKIDISNGSLTLNSATTRDVLGNGDTWTGDINTTTGGNLILDNFSHSTESNGGNYTQNGGSLVLQNGSELTIGNADSGISGGTVDIQSGNTLNVGGGGELSGSQSTTVAGALNVNDGGKITGGTTNVNNGGVVEVNNGGSITGGTTNVNNGANFNVNGGGSVTGGTTNVKDGGTVTVVTDGSISDNANTTIQSGGNVTVSGGTLNTSSGNGVTDIQKGGTLAITNDGQVTLDNNDKWAGKVSNDNSTLTLNNVTHNTQNGAYEQTNGTLNLENKSSLTLGADGTISDGTVNVTDSSFVVGNGGKVEGGSVTVNDGSSFEVQAGGQVTGGEVNFVGTGLTAQVSGDVLADAIFEITEGNKVVINSPANVTLNGDSTTGENWAGTVQLNGGTLNFTGTKDGTNGQFLGDKGNFNIQSGSQHFVVAADDYIRGDVVTNIASGSYLDVAGGDVELNANDAWNGTVSVSDGTLLLADASKNKDGVLTQTDGETTVTGNSFVLNNASDSISGGDLNIGTNEAAGTLTQQAGTISADAQVNINNNGTLAIEGGTTTLENTDKWNGTVELSKEGALTIDGIENNNGKLVATDGTLNLSNTELLVENGSTIGKDVDLTFGADSSMNIQNNGSVSFDKDNEWGGDVNLNGGTLNYSAAQNSALTAVSGAINTTSASVLAIDTGSYIQNAVDANIQGQLNISGTDAENGGYVTLGSGDALLGNTTLDNFGVLNLGDDVKMADSGQTITFNGADAVMNLETNNKLDLKAELVGADGQINKNGAGDVKFSGGTNQYKGNLLVNNSGDLTFVDENGFGGNLEFGDVEGKEIGIIADKIDGAITQEVDAKITYAPYRDIDLNFNDSVSVLKGELAAKTNYGKDVNFNSEVNVKDNASLTVHSGRNVNFNEAVNITGGTNPQDYAKVSLSGWSVNSAKDFNAENSLIYTNAKNTTFNNLSLTDSALQIAQNGLAAENLFISGNSSVQLMNGTITDNNVGNLQLDDAGVGNFTIDISPRDWTSDKILAGAITANGAGGTLNISDFQFINKCPIDRHVPLQIFDSSRPGYENIVFSATDKEIFTPIGYYGLFPSAAGNGSYTASLTRYNPQVYRGQVATMSTWQNQLTIDNLLFDHVQEINMQYLSQSNPNKYAAAYPQFAPYQYNKKDGSIWFKPFGVIEKLNMTQGLNVNNTFYGALIGADFPAVELKRGWTLLPTAYVGYTGAHQSFSGVGMYQNGGQAGAMATFMKNDFIGSIMAFGGGYNNRMDVAGYTDETGNWIAGTAAKAAYNFHPTKHFIIQPTVMAAYTYLGQQNWHSNFGDMSMRAEMLNGVNVAPGINFIYGRETWSIYATVQYFYNVLGYTGGRAGNDVDLPHMRMRHGFIQYGIGATKTWKDRFSGFLQIVIRNGGRTGIGFMGGITYKF